MIKLVTGNLLNADADAIVNTVNTVGVMGRGIAKQFKRAFPENFKAYSRACARGEVQLGSMFVFDRGLERPRWIINFPTKKHWRSKSRMADIRAGLRDLVETVEKLNVNTVALPPLGCGLGGLEWTDVEPEIRKAFEGKKVCVLLFEPRGAPSPDKQVDRRKRPNMTPTRALVVSLASEYLSRSLDLEVSLLELHKLTYFAEIAGAPTRLEHRAHWYGPYSDNLGHVLSAIEGHYTEGVGEGRNQPTTPLRVLDQAREAAQAVVSTTEALTKAQSRVLELTEGFEDSFGMELLGTVHWLATRGLGKRAPAADADEAAELVKHWTTRKRSAMSAGHIRIAWERLESHGWLDKQAN